MFMINWDHVHWMLIDLIKENGLVWFYDISTIVGYLMPKPFKHVNSSI